MAKNPFRRSGYMSLGALKEKIKDLPDDALVVTLKDVDHGAHVPLVFVNEAELVYEKGVGYGGEVFSYIHEGFNDDGVKVKCICLDARL